MSFQIGKCKDVHMPSRVENLTLVINNEKFALSSSIFGNPSSIAPTRNQSEITDLSVLHDPIVVKGLSEKYKIPEEELTEVKTNQR